MFRAGRKDHGRVIVVKKIFFIVVQHFKDQRGTADLNVSPDEEDI